MNRPLEGHQRARLEGQGRDVDLIDLDRRGERRGEPVGLARRLGTGLRPTLQQAEAPATGRLALGVVVGRRRPLEAAVGSWAQIGDVITARAETDKDGILDESRQGHR